MSLLGGRLEEAEVLLDATERAFADGADEPFAPSAGRAGSLLVNISAALAIHRGYLAALRGDGEATVSFTSQALAEVREGEQMLNAIAQGLSAVAQRFRGQLDEAEQGYATSIAGWQAAAQPVVAAWGCHDLSQVQRAQGRLDAAAWTCQQALEINAPAGQPAPPTAGPAYVELAEVAYQRNELDAALRHVTEGIALCRRLIYVPPLAAGLVALAWIRHAQGDAAGAQNVIGEAGRVAPGEYPGLFNPVPVQRARLLLAQGDVAAAARWTQERGLRAGDELPYHREPEYLLLARVLNAQDQPSKTLALLQRLHAAAAAQGRTGSIIEIQALQALALAAGGDQDSAVATLAQALTLACPQGYVRVFTDEARRWAPCSADWSRPSGRGRVPRAASRSLIWAGWRAPSSRALRPRDRTRPSARSASAAWSSRSANANGKCCDCWRPASPTSR
jgi:LuxR family maltose regulon positive regulatory protein